MENFASDSQSSVQEKLKLTVEAISLDSPRLSEVMALHAIRKSRLGQFPAGAFEDHARRQLILAAITSSGTVAGYLLYRIAVTKGRASIVHLTTADEFRGQGIARLLAEHLKAATRHLNGISLSCRQDYDLGGFWRSLGFTVRHSKQGRGSDGALLDWWWFSHGQEDLFSFSSTADSRMLAAIDANVFYDLTCEDRPQGEDTKVLQADWLQESLELCIAPELYNEIHRASDESRKKHARLAAQGFRELKADEGKVQKVESELKPWFNDAILPRDQSDLRQVAHAIAAETPFLITRDGPMLSRAEAVFENYGLRILHPTDLVNHMDLLRREAEYRPVRLEGSRWRERLVTATDVETITTQFKHPQKERANDFERLVRHHLALPNDWSCRLITDDSGVPAVFTVQRNGKSRHEELPMLRHSDHPLAGTLLRHLLHDLACGSTEGWHRTVVVTDSELSEVAKAALEELGFVSDGTTWWKLSIKGVISPAMLLDCIGKAPLSESIKAHFSRPELVSASTGDPQHTSRLECLFSPVKLTAPQTPCFVVSIRPDWAAHFFDVPGDQFLMDLKEKLHLGIEGAYYCASNNKHVSAPGRILWYVSKGPKGQGSMSIKACSHLAETMVGTPKELFARFRHLGVYAWKHVLATAGTKDSELVAFRFTRTERFVKEVPFSECQKLGIPQPVNPRRISDEQFAAIYRIGMNLKST